MTQNPAVEVAGPSRRHVPALDGVRGMAIVLVLVSHLMLFNDHTGSRFGDSLSALRGLGWVGVDLFFVLSGFLITGILFDTLQDPHYFRSFYMRRFLRIFPLYYGFLFFLLVLGHWGPGMHFEWNGRQYVLLTYLQNTGIWFPVTDFHPGVWADLDHFWSLAVEEQFYVFWPLLVFLVRGRRRIIALALALSGIALLLRIALYVHGSSPLLIFMLTPCRMDTLLVGGLAALVVRGDSDMDSASMDDAHGPGGGGGDCRVHAVASGQRYARLFLWRYIRIFRDRAGMRGCFDCVPGARVGCASHFPLVVAAQPGEIQLRHLRDAYFRGAWNVNTHISPAGHKPAHLVDTLPAFPPTGSAGGVLLQCRGGVSGGFPELQPV